MFFTIVTKTDTGATKCAAWSFADAMETARREWNETRGTAEIQLVSRYSESRGLAWHWRTEWLDGKPAALRLPDRGEGWRLAGRGGRALCFAEGYDGLFRALETRLKDGVITAWRARKGEWKYGVAVKRHTAL